MTKDRHRKSERKTKKRKSRLDAKRTRKEKASFRHRYPQFQVAKTGASPSFMAAVAHACATVNFDNKREFSDNFRACMKFAAENLVPSPFTVYPGKDEGDGEINVDRHNRDLALALAFELGDAVFRRIPEVDRARFLPQNMALLCLENKAITVTCRQFSSKRGEGGTIYFSPHRPTVDVCGTTYVVGFSRHAIERICQRLYPQWTHYRDALRAHILFFECSRFHLATLHPDQKAVTFFERLDWRLDNDFSFLKRVFGEDAFDENDGAFYYRVGYCPIVIDGEFAKAKTFLYPGFKGTPEYALLSNADLPLSERQTIKQTIGSQTAESVLSDTAVSALKWFHENGVPQVIQSKEQLFHLTAPWA